MRVWLLVIFEYAKLLKGKKILVTGSTGFTGGWLSLMLLHWGAILRGLALPPNTEPNLFDAIGLSNDFETTIGDIRDYEKVETTVRAFAPDAIVHLAAQPLVLEGYRDPKGTFDTNCQGTMHLLEVARLVPSVRAVVCITTDKVYRNKNYQKAYVETDELGGEDPYSASKAAAEMVALSYMKRYDDDPDNNPAIAVARGGNIIGGGDWAKDRIVPDFARSISSGSSLVIRNPRATRPWQHVLGLAEGYQMLLAGLLGDDPKTCVGPWNFGPLDTEEVSVSRLLEMFAAAWKPIEIQVQQTENAPEAQLLAIDSSRAFDLLGWRPAWATEKVVEHTAIWYERYYSDPSSAREQALEQIQAWRSCLAP